MKRVPSAKVRPSNIRALPRNIALDTRRISSIPCYDMLGVTLLPSCTPGIVDWNDSRPDAYHKHELLKAPQVELPYQGNLCINICNAERVPKKTGFQDGITRTLCIAYARSEQLFSEGTEQALNLPRDVHAEYESDEVSRPPRARARPMPFGSQAVIHYRRKSSGPHFSLHGGSTSQVDKGRQALPLSSSKSKVDKGRQVLRRSSASCVVSEER